MQLLISSGIKKVVDKNTSCDWHRHNYLMPNYLEIEKRREIRRDDLKKSCLFKRKFRQERNSDRTKS